MIIHNVTDRRNQWIGPWEAEDQFLSTAHLTEADKGRTVIYSPTREAGTLSSWTDLFVFVRFTNGDTAAACRPRDLVFAVRDATNDFTDAHAGRASVPARQEQN